MYFVLHEHHFTLFFVLPILYIHGHQSSCIEIKIYMKSTHSSFIISSKIFFILTLLKVALNTIYHSQIAILGKQNYCEKFEDTKCVIRSHKSEDRQYNDHKKEDRQYNDHKKEDKITNNVLQSTTWKTKDRVTGTPRNTVDELRSSTG